MFGIYQHDFQICKWLNLAWCECIQSGRVPSACSLGLVSGTNCYCTRMGWISTGHHRCPVSCSECKRVRAGQWIRGTVESWSKGSRCGYWLTMGKMYDLNLSPFPVKQSYKVWSTFNGNELGQLLLQIYYHNITMYERLPTTLSTKGKFWLFFLHQK